MKLLTVLFILFSSINAMSQINGMVMVKDAEIVNTVDNPIEMGILQNETGLENNNKLLTKKSSILVVVLILFTLTACFLTRFWIFK